MDDELITERQVAMENDPIIRAEKFVRQPDFPLFAEAFDEFNKLYKVGDLDVGHTGRMPFAIIKRSKTLQYLDVDTILNIDTGLNDVVVVQTLACQYTSKGYESVGDSIMPIYARDHIGYVTYRYSLEMLESHRHVSIDEPTLPASRVSEQ